MGPPQAFPHLVGEEGREEEKGQGYPAKVGEEGQDGRGEGADQKPPGEAVHAGHHRYGDHEPGEDVGVGVAEEPQEKPHEKGGQGNGRVG